MASLSDALFSCPYNRQYLDIWLHKDISDGEYRTINDPRGEMVMHVAQKGLAVGSLVGAAVSVLGVLLLRKRGPNGGYFLSRWGPVLGAACGAPAGAAAMSAKCRKMSEEEIFDRAYRARYNRNSMRLDQFSQGGFAAGVLAFKLCNPLVAAGWGCAMGAGAAFAYRLSTNVPSDKWWADGSEEEKSAVSVLNDTISLLKAQM